MSFFQKQETEKNLQYDDIAFLHFLLTIFICTSIVFTYLVYQRFLKSNVKNIKNYRKLKQSGLYTLQLINEQRRRKKLYLNSTFYCYLALLTISFLASISLIYYVGTHETQMIGFDPHQILSLSPDATPSQIKKAYRQLALKYHPDRNQNDPEAQAKFIMISKSYECLADQKKKQNCLKYGNPDGETSFQVGIGLPKFIISPENQSFILPVVFLILLVVIPMMFIKWSGKAQAKGSCGLDIRDYRLLYPFFKPEFNASFGFYCLTVLKELEFPDRRLPEQQKKKFLQFLSEKKLLDMNYVGNRMSENQLYVLHKLFKHMARKQPDVELCLMLPQVFNNLMNFATYFAKRGNEKRPLWEDKLPIHFLGTKHLFMLLEFIRTFYNCSLFNPPNFTPFDHLALSKEDYQVSMRRPYHNLRELVANQNKRKEHLSHFPQQHRHFLEMQLKDLPLLKLETKCKVGDQQVQEFTVEDFAQIYFRVSKLNETSGYCHLKKFPFLKEERYYFMLIFNDNLIHFQQVTFEEGSNEYVGKIAYRQGFARDMVFHAFVFSDCRYGLDAKQQVKFKVIQPKEGDQGQIEIHQDDRTIERRPKTYWEKMLSLEQENPSDNELSDTEDSEKDTTKATSKPNPSNTGETKPKKKPKLIQEGTQQEEPQEESPHREEVNNEEQLREESSNREKVESQMMERREPVQDKVQEKEIQHNDQGTEHQDQDKPKKQ